MGYHGGAGEPSGLGAPVKLENRRITENVEEEAHETGVLEDALPAPGPFRIDTTRLSTSNLPKPPVRRVDPNTPLDSTASIIAKKPKPSLPPRLPPRQASVDSNGSSSPPPSYSATIGDGQPKDSYLNEGALNRLGAAGVSVPGFGIGRASGGNQTTQDSQSPAKNKTTPIRAPALSELNAKFSRMSSSSTPPTSPSQGTTFAQKQAALKTASAFRNDPSSVSLSDARAAASTANNFRERHGDQVAAGVQGASNLNKKYGISNRLVGFAPTGGATSDQAVISPPASPAQLEQPAIEERKKPPPPPPRRPAGDSARVLAPPPVPFSNKPK